MNFPLKWEIWDRQTKEKKKDRWTNKERKTDGQTKEKKDGRMDRRTDKQKKEKKTKRDRQTTDRQKERLNFSVFPKIWERIFGNKLSIPIFGNKKLKLPDLFLKTGTRKLWCLILTKL